MRERLPSFNYLVPSTIDEAIDHLRSLEDAVILAGGTDLIVAMKLKGLRPKNVISMKKLKGQLSYIVKDADEVRIGALTCFHDIEKSPLIKEKFEVLHEAVTQIASYQIRNIATIGGNLCNASPAADSAPPLMVLGAKLIIAGPSGERGVPIERFFVGPGRTVLEKGEILKEIVIPIMPENSGASFVKLGRRKSEDISVASAAAFVLLEGNTIKDVRIALGSVAPTPIRAYNAEREILGKEISPSLLERAGEKAKEECSPITDVRASAEYRREMVRVLTRKALEIAINRAKGGG